MRWNSIAACPITLTTTTTKPWERRGTAIRRWWWWWWPVKWLVVCVLYFTWSRRFKWLRGVLSLSLLHLQEEEEEAAVCVRVSGRKWGVAADWKKKKKKKRNCIALHCVVRFLVLCVTFSFLLLLLLFFFSCVGGGGRVGTKWKEKVAERLSRYLTARDERERNISFQAIEWKWSSPPPGPPLLIDILPSLIQHRHTDTQTHTWQGEEFPSSSSSCTALHCTVLWVSSIWDIIQLQRCAM